MKWPEKMLIITVYVTASTALVWLLGVDGYWRSVAATWLISMPLTMLHMRCSILELTRDRVADILEENL